MRAPEFGGGRRRFDGYIALGCVIRGETTHYDHICNEVARGLQDMAIHHCLALGFGVLTTENRDQAVARAWVDRGNKRSEEHTSELQSLMRISYAVFCLKKKNTQHEPFTSCHISSE